MYFELNWIYLYTP